MSPKLIILVEDDLNLRQSIALILQRAGYFVTATDCVSKAMNIIQSGNYHLIIADINMPETRSVTPKDPRYVPLSIHRDLDGPVNLRNGKGGKLLSAHYLVKPIAPERLLDCVGTILGEKSVSIHNSLHDQPINPS